VKKLLGVGVVALIAAFMWNAAPASAHHPEVAAVNVCAEPGAVPSIVVTASAWENPDGSHRVNNEVRIDVDGPGADLTSTGAFTAPDYEIVQQFAVAGSVGQSLTVTVTAVDGWGPNGDLAVGGQIRQTTVTVADDCDEMPDGTTTTAAPTTTVPATTTTVGGGSAGTSIVPTTTITPEVGGVTQVRPQLPAGGAAESAAQLAVTGTDPTALLVGGMGLVFVGLGLVAGVRRRTV
jgi:hypothetical protein